MIDFDHIIILSIHHYRKDGHPMVPEDRKKQILELLEQHGYLTVE